MTETTPSHLDKLIKKAADSEDSCNAMRFSQAALNVANAQRVAADMPKD